MEVIVHIGYPKTATTFMQQEIFNGLECFECKGKDIKNISKLNYKIQNSKINKIKRIINSSNKNKLFSVENFLDLRRIAEGRVKIEEIAKGIKRNFDDTKYRTKILISIRKQKRISLSAFSFWSYDFEEMGFEDLNRLLKLGIQEEDERASRFVEALDYSRTASKFEEVFDRSNIQVVAYENIFNKGKSSMLKNIFGEENSEIFNRVDFRKKHNTSSSDGKYKKFSSVYKALSLIKSRYLPFLPPTSKIPLGKSVKKILNKRAERVVVNNDVKKMIRDRYGPSNRALSEKYGINLQELGYPYE